MNPLKFLFLSKKDPEENVDHGVPDEIEISNQLKRVKTITDPLLREAEMEKLIQKYPQSKLTFDALSDFYEDNSRHEEIISLQEQVLGFVQGEIPRSCAWNKIGLSCLVLKKYADAAYAFEMARQICSVSCMAYWGLGEVCRKRGELEKAKEYYLHFYDVVKNGQVSLRLGLIESELENNEQAASYFRDAISIEPDNASYYMELAKLYIKKEDELDLLKHLEVACDKFSSDYRLLSIYAKYLLLHGQATNPVDMELCAKALNAAQKAFEVNSCEIETRLVYATTLYSCQPDNKAMVEEAIDILKKTLSRSEDAFDQERIYFFLYKASMLVGREKVALVFLEKSNRLRDFG